MYVHVILDGHDMSLGSNMSARKLLDSVDEKNGHRRATAPSWDI